MKLLYFLVLFITIIKVSLTIENKYSAAANTPEEETRTLKDLEKPFRMQKVNLLWSKAKLRLTEPKLKSLFGALKLYDKEELVWKKVKADGQDKDGLRSGTSKEIPRDNDNVRTPR
ncbi:alpha-2-macroglobulin receptor-associated protein [Holotrichia oblita]|uniref:Alpha-2-macroglobulin receptor-associated protein n=1 Tax=Holotrichia oblita TaxID=644536 RepID=A0ACB9SWE5_HOLOL|nr:alpha-2-macroglobulin receptor-associated protein [Holotrichia oblita]